jgi:hypothetical protein
MQHRPRGRDERLSEDSRKATGHRSFTHVRLPHVPRSLGPAAIAEEDRLEAGVQQRDDVRIYGGETVDLIYRCVLDPI